MGMIGSLALWLEDRRIASHLRAVERLLRSGDTSGMSRSLKQRRAEMLDRLAGYIQREIFPRNRSGSLLTPVFVDPEGRECAVGHLIGRETKLVSEISRSHNLTRIREMPHPGLDRWQRESGLELDELALIQPGYPQTALSVAMGAVPGVMVLLVGVFGAWVSHGLRRIRFRLAGGLPNNGVVALSVLAALAGWWLIGRARGAWALPGPEAGSYAWVYAWRDVAFDVMVWVLMAFGVVGVVFGLATVLRRIISSGRLFKGSPGSNSLVESLERGTTVFTRACLALVGPLVWAWGVIIVTQLLFADRLCSSGRAILSQWLPLPHTRCVLDGQVVATSYADTLFVLLALAPLVWVVTRFLTRVQSSRSLPSLPSPTQ